MRGSSRPPWVKRATPGPSLGAPGHQDLTGGTALLEDDQGRSIPARGAKQRARLTLLAVNVGHLTRAPGSDAVVGDADTGCQRASILGDFGAQVTVVIGIAPARRPRR